MIQVENISFQYGEEGPLTLEDISLEIPPGQWVALVGANGSGKSTLARHLNGLLLPGAGRVLVDDHDTADPEQLLAVRQKVAFVFQNPDNQIVATTVVDDIAFGPENLGTPPAAIKERVEQALAITGLTRLAEQPPYLLSGGEKQRLAIAGAVAMNASYLVMDEPTSMLDPRMRAQVLKTLAYLHQNRGTAIIYITNIMEEALLAQRLLVLQQGRLVGDGPPRELIGNVEQFAAWGLQSPLLTRLAARLAAAGHTQLAGALTLEEMVARICK